MPSMKLVRIRAKIRWSNCLISFGRIRFLLRNSVGKLWKRKLKTNGTRNNKKRIENNHSTMTQNEFFSAFSLISFEYLIDMVCLLCRSMWAFCVRNVRKTSTLPLLSQEMNERVMAVERRKKRWGWLYNVHRVWSQTSWNRHHQHKCAPSKYTNSHPTECAPVCVHVICVRNKRVIPN